MQRIVYITLVSCITFAHVPHLHADDWPAADAVGANHPVHPPTPEPPTAPTEPAAPAVPDSTTPQSPAPPDESASQRTQPLPRAGQGLSLDLDNPGQPDPLAALQPDSQPSSDAPKPTRAHANAPPEHQPPANEQADASPEHQPLGSDASANSQTATLDTTGGWLLNTLAALAIVIGLIFVLRWVYSRASGQTVGKPSAAVEVLSRTPVAPKNHILLVRVGPRVLIVGDSAAGLRTLEKIDEPQEVADLLASVTASREQSISQSFSNLLNRFSNDHDDDSGSDDSEILVDRARNSVSGLTSRIRALSTRGANP